MPFQRTLQQTTWQTCQSTVEICITRSLSYSYHPHGVCISEIRATKTYSDKCLKGAVSENPSRSNIGNVPKHFRNMRQSTVIIFIDHFQVNWVGKSLSYWHEISKDCLLTHWLWMKTILFLIETTWRYQFRCNYLRDKKLFPNFFLRFWNLD